MTFRKKCEKVAEEMGIEVDFHDDSPAKSDTYEDDGTLHIRRRGLRAAFDVSNGQALDGKSQNENTRKVLVALGMAALIGGQTMVDDVEEDECPHCGRMIR